MLERPFIFLIKLYQKILSPLKPPSCRFTPTCSAYAYKAINEWGVIIGLALGAYRLLRCNPLCRCGEDDIPHFKRKIIPKTNVFERFTWFFLFFYQSESSLRRTEASDKIWTGLLGMKVVHMALGNVCLTGKLVTDVQLG